MRRNFFLWLSISTFFIFLVGFLIGVSFGQHPDLQINRLLTLINLQQADSVEDAERHLSAWSKNLQQFGHLLDSPCDSEVIKIVNDDPRFTAYGMVEPNGDVICTSELSTTNVNLADRPYFQQALETKQLSMSGFQVGRFTGKSVIAYALPVLNTQGEVTQVAFIGIDLAWVNRLFNNFKLPSGMEVVMTDANGVIELYYPTDDTKIGQSVFDPKIFSIVLSQQTGKISAKGVDGVTRMYYYGPIYLDKDEEADAFLLVGLPRRPIIDFSPIMPVILFGSGLVLIVVQFKLLRRFAH
ncbi:MAG: hypothetical protein UY13_C0002G0134 [Candidatus Pacebacteria bacterium GW2011_GWB1_47_8]|nr:MAG: hypothetical protein UX28_C0001G0283 [Candidatus Pacebacteria bacterium GW2011_GWA1_46_10]KKU84222.1 MAG: hypothetical protein UY13_C0002G0134 [Candidatus Pacebacteria bacterium GW2011_GWB1_47_8]HCR81327.1 hypothetical protein [Candidatus Paceibacterota bacterium]